MKKILMTSLVAALVVGALVAPAEAGKKKKAPKPRAAEGTYDNPAVGVPGAAGSGAAGGAFEFATMSNENFISVEIVDDRGGTPTFTMSQNTDPSDEGYEIMGTWCGSTPEPVQISPGLAVRVSVYTTPGVGQPSCVSPASAGTISATFTQ